MISRAFGDFILDKLLQIEPTQDDIKLLPGFRNLVLASDGLWDIIYEKDLVGKYLNVKQNPSNIAQNLVNYAKVQGSGDNISCLLYTSPSPRDRQKSRMPSSA
eukprot:TRINITY_DN25542_c0_g1_i1.p3 TRINITY_DN25542_c0_g1~~TRINITY_DN25542_c0_g1_i1.p3  ORF type:complete len:103 (+),score=24.80 TRINITY_DN25542_c0_g1_i1:205-513(+)